MLKKKNEIITIEDHLQDGGFGSWMLEANSLLDKESNPIKANVKTIALSSKVCGTVGSQSTLNKMGGIVSES